jgi:hypothetical protein
MSLGGGTSTSANESPGELQQLKAVLTDLDNSREAAGASRTLRARNETFLATLRQYRQAGMDLYSFLSTQYIRTGIRMSSGQTDPQRTAKSVAVFDRDREQTVGTLKSLLALGVPSPESPEQEATIPVLSRARQEYSRDLDLILNLSVTQTDLRFALVTTKDATTAGTLVCRSIGTNATEVAVPVEITFRDLPRAVLAGGLVLSTVAARQIGVQAVSGTAQISTVQYAIYQSEISPQVIPFLFAHVREFQATYKKRTFTVNFSPGVGLNPRSPGPRAEFAVGGSISEGNVYFTGGVHIASVASLSNGYRPGYPVPANFVPPTSSGWIAGPMFAITYRIPLKY